MAVDLQDKVNALLEKLAKDYEPSESVVERRVESVIRKKLDSIIDELKEDDIKIYGFFGYEGVVDRLITISKTYTYAKAEDKEIIADSVPVDDVTMETVVENCGQFPYYHELTDTIEEGEFPNIPILKDALADMANQLGIGILSYGLLDDEKKLQRAFSRARRKAERQQELTHQMLEMKKELEAA